MSADRPPARPPARARTLLLAALVLSATGCTCASRDATRDAGPAAPPPSPAPRAEPRDGGPVEGDAGPITDAGAARPTLPPPLDPAVGLQETIDALTELVEGRLPADFDVQTLFEVDLLDDEAVAARVAELRAHFAAPEPTPTTDAGPPDAGRATDAALPDGAILEDAAVPAEPPDAGRFDAGPLPDGAVPAPDAGPPAPPSTPSDELELLRDERDRLRLRFLSLPAAERRATIVALRDRQRLAAEEEASRADLARANEEARLATRARQEALDQRALSASAIERDLLAERARLEQARQALAEFEGGLARRRQQVVRRDADRLEAAHEVERLISSASLTGPEADERYDDLVETLVGHREDLDAALDVLGTESAAPDFEPRLDPEDALYEGIEARRDLLSALARFEGHRVRVVEAEEIARWDRVTRLARDVRRLDGLRIELLPRMTRAHRETVLGLGPEGRSQLRRELTQARLMMRFWGQGLWRQLPEVPSMLGDALARESSRNELLLVFFLVAVLSFGFNRRASLTERLRQSIYGATAQRGGWRTAVRPFWPVIGPLFVPLLVVAGLHWLFAIFAHATDSVLLEAARVVVLGYSWMFVAVEALSRFFVSRLRRGETKAAIARRVLSSVRLVLGTIFTVYVGTSLALLFVGRGYLYEIVTDVAWLGVLPIAAILVHRWADDVIGTHVSRHPSGFCAKRLAKGDHRLKRYLLTIPGGLQLAYEGATTTFKELALRFDQSRRAFAFLFRRRLEKAQESVGANHDWNELPLEVREAFDGDPVDPSFEIERFPQLDPIAKRVRAWKDGGPGFAVALVGERGVGKTSWMRALARRTELEDGIIDVPHGLGTPADVCRWVSEILDLEPCTSVDEVADRVERGGVRHVLLLDHCQNLVVRAIGGMVALETLVELAARTSESVTWVCAFSRYNWLYLERARQSQNLFSEQVELTPWSEEQIVRLIRHRMDTLGVEVSFKDLVVEQVDGGALEDAIVRTEGEYLRLLWDYADGNPRVAMHYWLHSLVPKGGGLHVQLFASPPAEALEALHEQSRFLLASIVLHENLTLREAARTVGMSRPECAALFAYLEQRHYVVEDERGQWRLSTHWYRAIIRHLRRRRLLFN